MGKGETSGPMEIAECLQLYAVAASQADAQDTREAAALVAEGLARYLTDLRGNGDTAPLVEAISTVLRSQRILAGRPPSPTARSITITASYTIRVKNEEAAHHLALRRIRQHGLEGIGELRARRDPVSSVAALYEVDGWQPDSYDTKAIEVLDANWSIGKTRKS